MRRGVDLVREQSVLPYDGLLKIALAGAENEAGDVDRALAILNEALATSERIGHRAFDAEARRCWRTLLNGRAANAQARMKANQPVDRLLRLSAPQLAVPRADRA